MLEQKRNAALGVTMGVLLLAGTTAQASAQATTDSSKAPDAGYLGLFRPERADTGVPAASTDTSAMKADTGMAKMGADTGMSKMGNDSTWTDTSKGRQEGVEEEAQD